MNKIKFNPEFNLGHLIYLGGLIVTITIFWVKTEARLAHHDNTLATHEKQIETLTAAQNLLTKNQAILDTLIQERSKYFRTQTP